MTAAPAYDRNRKKRVEVLDQGALGREHVLNLFSAARAVKATYIPASMPATIRDPRRPEVMLWLSTLGAEERLTMLLALKFAFRRLEVDKDWAAMIKRTCDELKPTPRQHEQIVLLAGKVSANIKAELASA